MVFFNYTTMQMTAKIVYYGPGLCGKTTNLHWIHHKTAPKSRGEMVSLETETDRTLFFDLLPIDVGVIGGMKVRLQLYTVPGQVFYNATRKLVLKGVDGVVFVADSQVAALDANVESFGNLKENLAELSLTVDTVPLVLQYNKRDIRNIVPVPKMNEVLNPTGKPFFEAAALHGIGVFETLKEISRLAITSVRKKVEAEDPRRKARPGKAATPKPAASAVPATPAAAAPVEATATPPSPPPVEAAAPPVEAEKPRAPARPNGSADVKVEFAEADSGPSERPVKTKANRDIHQELAGLRRLTRGNSPAVVATSDKPRAAAAKSSIDQRLQDMLGPGGSPARSEVKKKARLEVPAALLRSSTGVKIQLTFDGPGLEGLAVDALTIALDEPHADGIELRLDVRPAGTR